MKKTLLGIVQIILSKMDSDDVNSIGDTTESLQVAQEVETTFYEILNGIDVPEREKLISFESLQEPILRPNYLKTKEMVDNFKLVMYNIGTSAAPDWKEIKYQKPTDFLARLNNTNSSATRTVTDINGAPFTCITDEHPTYYTTFDDDYLVFDSYDSTVDDTLQESKAYGIAQVMPTFSMTDDYVPELPAKYFPMLIAEAASMCFINHKQAPNSKEEQRSHRQMVRQLNNRRRNADFNQRGPDFGRKT